MFTVIGGFRNTRVLIRKRINGAVLADVYWPNVLSEWKKKKFVFEVTLGGEIQLYSEDNPYKPMVTAFDPKPITIDYMSFRNLARETLSLYYGNAPEKTQEKILSELLTAQYGTVTVNPLLENWNLLLPHLNLKSKLKIKNENKKCINLKSKINDYYKNKIKLQLLYNMAIIMNHGLHHTHNSYQLLMFTDHLDTN